MSLPQIVVLGAGLGGTIAAYEIRDAVKGRAEVTVVNDQEDYWFVPSNPWVAAWQGLAVLDAEREAIEAEAALAESEGRQTVAAWQLNALTGSLTN